MNSFIQESLKSHQIFIAVDQLFDEPFQNLCSQLYLKYLILSCNS